MVIIAALGSVILALVSVISWLWGKNKIAQALLSNNTVKDQLNALDGDVIKNQALIQAAQEELERRKNEKVSQDSILDAINKSNK